MVSRERVKGISMILQQASTGTSATASNRRWRALLTGTALGCSLFAAPAMAQVIDETATGDVEIATEAAESIRGHSTAGNVSIVVPTVQNEATTGSSVYGLADSGNVTMDIGTVTAGANGLEARTPGGGDITIDVDTVNAGGRGIYTNTLFVPGEGFTSGNTIIRAGSVVAAGGNAIIGQGYSVLVDAELASGQAIPSYASTVYVGAGAGGADVNVRHTVAEGDGQWGVDVRSAGDARVVADRVDANGAYGNRAINVWANGNANITAGTLSTSGNESFGIFAAGYTAEPQSFVINSGSITTTGDNATAIYAPIFGEGQISITSGTIVTTGANAHGILVGPSADGVGFGSRPADPNGGTGELTIVSDSITIDSGYAIGVDHRGPISIDSGTIASTGSNFGGGIYVYGVDTIDIKSQSINTPNGTGIIVYGDTGDVTIDSGLVAVGEGSDSGVFAQTSTGNISIKAAQTSTLVPDLRYYAPGNAVYAYSQSGDIQIESGIATTAGTEAVGVGAWTDGTVSVASTEVSTQGDRAYGVFARGIEGVTVTSGDVTTAGVGAHGLYAGVGTGAMTLQSNGTVSTAGESAHGIYAVGGVGGGTGSIFVESASVQVTGEGANALRGTHSRGGDVNFTLTGAHSAAAGTGAYLSTLGTANLTLSLDASLAGRTGAHIDGAGVASNINNAGLIEGNEAFGLHITSTGSTVVVNEDTGRILGANVGIFAESGTLDLTNYGIIRGEGTSDNRDELPGAGINIASAGARVVNAGTISGAGFGISTSYYLGNQGLAIGTEIENSGTIRGEDNDGVRLIGGGTVTNDGTISGTITTTNGSQGVDGVSMFGFEGQNRSAQDRIGTVTNNAEGDINGHRFGIILSGGGEVINAGTITGGNAAIRIQGDTTSPKTAIVNNSGDLVGGVSVGFNIDSVSIANSGAITATAQGHGIAASARTVVIDNSNEITATADNYWAIYTAAAETMELTNSGTIEGANGVYAAAGGSSLAFVNSGTIRALGSEEESGEAVSLATGYNALNDTYTTNAQTASFENTVDGVIEGEVTLEFYADTASFTNAGLILASNPGDSVIDFSVYGMEGPAESVSFTNEATGRIRGAVEAELSTLEAVFVNRGSILAEASEEDGGQPALDIENLTAGSHSVSFTNAAGASIVSNGVGGIGVILQSGAGLNAPEEGGEPTIGDDPLVLATLNVVNDGTIIANDGGEVTDVSDWGIEGVDTMVTFGGGLGMVALAPNSEATLTNGATGVIEATGEYSIAVYAEAGTFTLNNAGRITGSEGSLIDSSMMDGGDYTVIHDLLEVGSTYVAGAIQTLDSVDTINNTGTITGSVDLNNRDDLFINSGIVNGTVDMGDGNDVVRLETGSSVVGVFYGGEGNDRFELAGTSGTLINSQTVAVSDGFEELLVRSGYWVANSQGAASVFDSVSIAQGATLDVREVSIGGGPASAVVTEVVENNGLLILNFNSDDLADIDVLQISGSGDVRLGGEANFLLDQAIMAFTGKTIVANGSLTLAGTGGLSGDVETSGDGTFVLGDGGTTGSFEGNLVNNGRFVFNRTDDYSFLGDFSGTGSFTKRGAGVLTFAGGYSYTGTTVIEGGRVKFLGDIDPETEVELEEGTFDISDKPQTIAQLSGSQDSAINVNNSQLTVNQSSNTAYAGAITGDGAIVKTGSGTLNLTGNSTYTGPTTVNEGALAVNGSIVSVVTVNNGGTLKGTGTVGGATVTSNGTLAPGNSIGTLRVVGDVTFAAGSTYEVEVNADGRSDQILATGRAIIQGGTVAVVAEAGTFRPFTEYLIIGADGGVTGTFNNVTSNYAFLTPTLTYGTNAVRLQLLRNDIDFAAVAATGNQASTANAIEGLGVRNDLYGDIAVLTEAGARTAFDALSGEAYASIGSGILANGRLVADALLGAGDTGGTGVWAQALGDWGSFDAAPGVAGLDSDHQGVIGGVNYGANGFAIGAAFGASKSDYDVRGRMSQAEVDTKLAGVHAGYGAGPVTARIGGSYAWHDIDASRSIVFPTFSEDAEATYDATTMQLFGEVGYKVPVDAAVIEPFARIEHLRLKTDGFGEDGDTAALTIDEETRKLQFLSLGVRATGSAPVSSTMTLEPQLSAAWRRGWGDLEGRSSAAFDGSDAFDIVGARLPKNALDLDVGVGLRSGNVRVGISYRGILSNQWNSDGGQVSIGFTF